MAMYILSLSFLDLDDDQGPSLTIKLLDPESQLETTLEIKNINRVEFQEKNIGLTVINVIIHCTNIQRSPTRYFFFIFIFCRSIPEFQLA